MVPVRGRRVKEQLIVGKGSGTMRGRISSQLVMRVYTTSPERKRWDHLDKIPSLALRACGIDSND
jgi:hypothetical protein